MTRFGDGFAAPTRRGVLLGGGALVLGAGLAPTRLMAQDLVKVAGIYTVPGLCCTNRLLTGLPLSPGRPIPRPL